MNQQAAAALMDVLHRCGEEAARNPQSYEEPVPSDGIRCGYCHNSGWVPVLCEDGITRLAKCPHCYNRRMVVRNLKRSGVSPEDYGRYTLAAFDGSRSETARRMKSMALDFLENHKPGQKNGPGFGIFGSSGVGKTHICIAVCHELTTRFGEPHFYFSYRSEIPDLVKAARSYRGDYEAAMYKWKTCQNLYIDDLFKLSGRLEDGHLVDIDPDEHRVMFDIINARYLNHLTTLVSSEYSVKDISNIDQAMGSRIFSLVSPYGLRVEGRNQRWQAERSNV